MKRSRLWLLLAAVLAVGCFAEPAAAEQVTVPLASGDVAALTAELHLPAGRGPFPAAVIVHGCGGVGRAQRHWGHVLADQGYAALVLDSFTARGIRQECTRGTHNVSAEGRAEDARAGARYLAGRSDIARDRIALIGESQGGAATLFAVLSQSGKTAPPSPFAAAIAFYPDCTMHGQTGKAWQSAVPLMILVGALDDWTPPHFCRDLVASMPRTSAPVTLHVYPGAYHAFDSIGTPVHYNPTVGNRHKPDGCCGATTGYDAPAYQAALADVTRFLEHWLLGY